MKRSICLLLSVVMLITALPMGAFAQTEPAQQAQPEVAADVSLEGSNSFGNLLADELETLSGGDEKEPDAGAGQGMASPYPPADGAGHGASDGIYEG